VAGAAATGVFAISRYRGAGRRNLTQFAIMAADNEGFTPSFNKRVAMSPDGTRIAFNSGLGGAAVQTFYLRSFSELESKRIKDVPNGGSAFFSPDGLWIGFISNAAPQAIRKVALSGGAPITICPHEGFAGATWMDRDSIYFVG